MFSACLFVVHTQFVPTHFLPRNPLFFLPSRKKKILHLVLFIVFIFQSTINYECIYT